MPRARNSTSAPEIGGGGGASQSFTVTFELRGGIGNIPPLTVPKGKTITKPTDPTKDKYTLGGWYTDEKLTTVKDFAIPITTDLTLYAKWNLFNHFTVTFALDGGTGNDGTGNNGAGIAEQIIEKDGMATAPTTIPTKAGLTFVDWYTDSAPTSASTAFQFTTPITSNTILYAGWKATVMFNTHIATKTVFIGSTITRPKNPTRTGFVFVDWYTDSALTTLFDFDAETITTDTPIYAGWASTWSMVAAGGFHTVGIKADGTLWAWGSNWVGQLGLGNKNAKTIPTQVVGATWKAIASGRDHTVGIKKDGTLWAWGLNDNGQLGLGNKDTKTIPTKIGSDTDWKSVAAGKDHTVGIKKDGTLWAWGMNADGQLGLENKDTKDTLTKVGTDKDWNTVVTGATSPYTVGIKADGTLWAWGNNDFGQLGTSVGDKTRPTKVVGATWKAIAAGAAHTVGINKADDTLYAWGSNNFGQLGLGNKNAKTIPTQVVGATWKAIAVGAYHTVGIKADDTLYAWGAGYGGTRPTKVGTATWLTVAAGKYHTVAIKNDDTLWAWGNNDEGQLGLGNKTNQTSPTRVKDAPTTPAL